MHSCKIFIVNEKMKHLCICQQPKNSDLFKGHGQTPPGGLWATVGVGGMVSWGHYGFCFSSCNHPRVIWQQQLNIMSYPKYHGSGRCFCGLLV